MLLTRPLDVGNILMEIVNMLRTNAAFLHKKVHPEPAGCPIGDFAHMVWLHQVNGYRYAHLVQQANFKMRILLVCAKIVPVVLSAQTTDGLFVTIVKRVTLRTMRSLPNATLVCLDIFKTSKEKRIVKAVQVENIVVHLVKRFV